jgi:hypothetical protein
MVDWYDPATWRDGIKTAADLANLVKLLDGLRKKMARKGGREDTRERLDALIGIVKDMVTVVESNHNTTRNHLTEILEIIKTQERRLKALEGAVRRRPR